ncbi:hypothetical protein F8M41_020328 [Gigaspora margarita]|uniref:Uncharacterized protein n=1 Tax=Gigaspora margarita TaxID=4874 RepID=A0A8H4AIM3_GIGMA|nr:hypothetical protein F8M41_020328 [Gigaspora margarita]
MSDVKEKEFELFFADKSNVNMSSYQVNKASGPPILYLQDQKKALWSKFESLYPNKMKKISFMGRLAIASNIKYREDLKGLCQICSQYGFEVFEDLIAIVRSKIKLQEKLVSI